MDLYSYVYHLLYSIAMGKVAVISLKSDWCCSSGYHIWACRSADQTVINVNNIMSSILRSKINSTPLIL